MEDTKCGTRSSQRSLCCCSSSGVVHLSRRQTKSLLRHPDRTEWNVPGHTCTFLSKLSETDFIWMIWSSHVHSPDLTDRQRAPELARSLLAPCSLQNMVQVHIEIMWQMREGLKSCWRDLHGGTPAAIYSDSILASFWSMITHVAGVCQCFLGDCCYWLTPPTTTPTPGPHIPTNKPVIWLIIILKPVLQGLIN